MGRDGGLTVAARPHSYSEEFEKVCPAYIAMGMTYEQFWDGDNEMPRMFRKAHKLKLREANQMAWLQGAYVYQAVGALAPALKAFSKSKPQDYLERPIGWDDDIEEKKPEEKPVKKDNEHARIWLEMWAANFNEKFDEQNETKGGELSG